MTVSLHHEFTPNLLHSYSQLKEYIGKNRTVEEIRNQSETPKNLFDSWQIVELQMTGPLVRIYTIFLGAISHLLFYAGLIAWSIQLSVHKRLYQKDERLKALQIFGKNCLAFSINARAQNSDDVYLQSPLRVEDIASRRVRALIDPGLPELTFYQDGGCCRGMSEWFFYLYFQTQDNFQNKQAHIQRVGEQFSQGAPSEAVLLQTMCPPNRELLGLKAEETHVLHAHDPFSTDSPHQRISELFKTLEPGCYAVNLPRHRLNYISLSPGKGYLFDPVDGTIAIKNTKGIDALGQRVLTYIRDSDPTILSLETIQPI